MSIYETEKKRQIIEVMKHLTFIKSDSSFNNQRYLIDKVDGWSKASLLRCMIAKVKHNRSMATAKMQACIRLFKMIDLGSTEKTHKSFKVMLKYGLFEEKMIAIGCLIEARIYQAGFDSINVESHRVAKHIRKIKRFEVSTALRTMRSTFREMKRHWEHVRSMNQLGAVFNKMHGQMEVKGILTKWRRFVFNNDKSWFHKSISAKDHHKSTLRRHHFNSWHQSVKSASDRRTRLVMIDTRQSGRLVKTAWRCLVESTVQGRQRKRFEILNRVMRAWRSEVESVVQERLLEKIVNEDSQQQSVHDARLRRKRDKNERFMWLLMAKDAPPEVAMRLAGRGGDREYTDKNQTEFSSEDWAGEDIAIKSAL